MEQTKPTGENSEELQYYAEVHLTFGKSFELSLSAADVHDAREKVGEMLKTGLIRWGDKSGDMDKGDSIGFDPANIGLVKLTRLYPEPEPKTTAALQQPPGTAEAPLSQ